MKKAYIYIFIGTLFTLIEIPVRGVDFLNNAVGYLLILLGILYAQPQRPLKELKQAKALTITLCFLEIAPPTILPILSLHSFIPFAIDIFKIAFPIYLFYCLIKADYIWSPCKHRRNYLYRYSMLGLTYLSFSLLVLVAPQLLNILIFVTAIHSAYILYILFQLQEKSLKPQV